MLHSVVQPQTDLTMAGLAERLGGCRIEASDLERAWQVTHRPDAPSLSWGQRFLVLSSLFGGRSTSWVLALEARLCALEEHVAAQGVPPDRAVFEAAACARLEPHGDELQFSPDTPWR